MHSKSSNIIPLISLLLTTTNERSTVNLSLILSFNIGILAVGIGNIFTVNEL